MKPVKRALNWRCIYTFKQLAIIRKKTFYFDVEKYGNVVVVPRIMLNHVYHDKEHAHRASKKWFEEISHFIHILQQICYSLVLKNFKITIA